MIIDSIYISGYKNLSKVKIDLDSITSLVAPNGFGKSNFIEAMHFGIDFIKCSASLKSSLMNYSKAIPLNKHLEKNEFEFYLEMSKIKENTKYKLEYGFSFEWAKDGDTGAKITKEILKIKNVETFKFSNYINRTKTEGFVRKSETGRCNSPVKIKDNELILNKLLAFDDLFYLDFLNEINDISFLENKIEAYDCFSQLSYERFKIDNADAENFKNIPKYIYYLKKFHADKYEMLIYAFKSIFPNILEITAEELDKKIDFKSDYVFEDAENVPFTISNKLYEIYVVEANLNQPIPFHYLSDGTKKVLLLLTIAISSELSKISVIAIEELENSIHPALLQKMLIVLANIIGNCKIILTSHSPYLVNYLEPENIYVAIPNLKGIACFGKILDAKSKKIKQEAKKYDQYVGEYIFSLLSGDQDDYDLIYDYTGVTSV